jgi:hypothetical protein
MIDVKQLRVGNIIKTKDGNLPYWVITEEDLITILQAEDRSIYLPVKLDDEMLERLGFHKHNNSYVEDDFTENNSRFYFSIWINYDEEFTYNSSEFNVELKSVHQLQNLYFDLKNKELQLK